MTVITTPGAPGSVSTAPMRLGPDQSDSNRPLGRRAPSVPTTSARSRGSRGRVPRSRAAARARDGGFWSVGTATAATRLAGAPLSGRLRRRRPPPGPGRGTPPAKRAGALDPRSAFETPAPIETPPKSVSARRRVPRLPVGPGL